MAEPNITQAAIDAFLRQNFGASYNTVFQPYLTKNNPFASWLGNRQNDYFNQYTGQVAAHPNWNFMNFLTGTGLDNAGNAVTGWAGIDPAKEWNAMAPSQRGEHPSQYAPGLKWLSMFGGR